MLSHVVDHGGLEPGEGEVVALAEHRPGEPDRGGIAIGGEAVDGGAARIAEAEEAGNLVEGLAGGVVDGLAEHLVAAVVLHDDEQRVAARHDERRRGEARGRDPGASGVEMRLEVVDPHEREARRRARGLGGGDADEQRAGEAGAVENGDGVEIAGVADARFASAASTTGG